MSGMGSPVAGMPGSGVAPPRQYWEDLFTYEIDFQTLVHATTQNGQIQIQGDSDFKWVKAAFFADLAGAAVTESTKIVPLATVQIQDGGSGRNLMSAAVPIPSLFGSGELPFILPIPRIFKAKTTVNFTVANYSAATDYGSVRLSLIGTKIFQGGPPQ